MNFKSWKTWVGLVVVGLVVVGGSYLFWTRNSAEGEAYTVTTDEAMRQDLTEYISTTGTIEPINKQDVFGDGMVDDVQVAVGDEVNEGDVLATYQSPETEATEITANQAGTVTAVNVTSGQVDTNAQQGQPSITVADLSHLEVHLTLSKQDASDVQVDQAVELTYNDETYNGTVKTVDPVARPEQAQMGNNGNPTLAATISFDDDQDLSALIAGFEIDLDITVNEAENTLTVPIEALQYNSDNEPFVYIIENEKARQIAIQTGIQSGTVIEVTGGDLREGDQIILSPDDELTDGDPVTIKANDDA
ncbi:efflux RND transporter periplasmic adaptor subunit [Dolosigranulum pigrum]|jgi:efflux transporter, RND family, MFP subunit|uniref:efflux RND transporter periplasmic adaptor subunit n=1 Tax=Dolosigranulum pigrum TaxID=29394 RepID=UPI0015EC1C02|nr:efflux RND transporter periplasmic adaptor subunit [Dolosigranulum pigrum]